MRKDQPLAATVILIRAALGDEIEDAATGPAKLGTEQTSLNRDLGDCIFVIDHVRWTSNGDVVVLGSVDEIVVAARALTVDGKLR